MLKFISRFNHRRILKSLVLSDPHDQLTMFIKKFELLLDSRSVMTSCMSSRVVKKPCLSERATYVEKDLLNERRFERRFVTLNAVLKKIQEVHSVSILLVTNKGERPL